MFAYVDYNLDMLGSDGKSLNGAYSTDDAAVMADILNKTMIQV